MVPFYWSHGMFSAPEKWNEMATESDLPLQSYMVKSQATLQRMLKTSNLPQFVSLEIQNKYTPTNTWWNSHFLPCNTSKDLIVCEQDTDV